MSVIIFRSTILASAVASFLMIFGNAAFAAQDAATIAQHMNKEKYTKSEIKSYMKDMKGKDVTASGKVQDVESGKRGEKVVLWITVPGREKNFVVDAIVDDVSKFHKNDSVTCTGKFEKYNIFSLNGLTLKDSKCSKK